jgi:2-amino-4-hydroxy-6-hydroxymethyldihydropteridine diphosphokinase
VTRAYVGLGSNLGDRERFIRTAIEHMNRIPESSVIRVSSLYDSEPAGDSTQPRYLNAVAVLETELSPERVLWNLLLIEKRLGRERVKRWGPRQIDLDLLFFGDRVIEEPDLTVPHPEVEHRAFVLVPMVELDPTFVHPRLGVTVGHLLRERKLLSAVRWKGRFWY